MIRLVVGPPGAGKTYYAVREFEAAILAGKFVATNVVLADDWAERIAAGIPRLKGRRQARAAWCAKVRRRVLHIETLAELARVRLSTDGFEKNPEGRGVAIFDEAGEALDARAWNEDKQRRRADNRFMRQHRKLGWDVVLIAQEEEQLDARVRGMAEYVVRLKNLKRAKVLGIRLAPFNLFLALWSWHGMAMQRPAKREWFTLSRRVARLYNTNQLVAADDQAEDVVWLPLPAPPQTVTGPAEPAAMLRAVAPAQQDLPADVPEAQRFSQESRVSGRA